MYQTNQQAWDEVMAGVKKSEELSAVSMKLYGVSNFKTLKPNEINLVYDYLYSKK